MSVGAIDRAVNLIKQHEQRGRQPEKKSVVPFKICPSIISAYRSVQQATDPNPFIPESDLKQPRNSDVYNMNESYNELLSRLDSLGVKLESVKPGFFVDLII